MERTRDRPHTRAARSANTDRRCRGEFWSQSEESLMKKAEGADKASEYCKIHIRRKDGERGNPRLRHRTEFGMESIL